MPIVTISRMYGSGGSDVAARVAEQLGWELLDNRFIDEVARRAGITPAEVSAREERVSSLIERLATAMALGSPEMMPPLPDAPLPPTEERLVEITRRVVEEAVSHGPLVVVGRGAQCMLAERQDAMHVFCYAPLNALVARSATRLHASAEEARKAVEETNRQREQYVKKHWNRSWRAHANYHICLNTEWLGVDGAADVVVRLARERLAGGAIDSGGSGGSGGARR
ncbi:MAG: AAA family ATPase [Gemmatimonadaceae bacterium]